MLETSPSSRPPEDNQFLSRGYLFTFASHLLLNSDPLRWPVGEISQLSFVSSHFSRELCCLYLELMPMTQLRKNDSHDGPSRGQTLVLTGGDWSHCHWVFDSLVLQRGAIISPEFFDKWSDWGPLNGSTGEKELWCFFFRSRWIVAVTHVTLC